MARKYVVPVKGASGRVIGKVVGDTFIKTVQGGRHFMRTPPAICIDTVAVRKLEELEILNIQVNDTDSGLRYRASVAYFAARAFAFNRGHGDQLGLPLTDWGVSKDGKDTAVFAQRAPKKQREAIQGELF